MTRVQDMGNASFKRYKRIVPFNNKWWFRTREGEVMGPYISRSQAEEGVEVYVALVSNHFVAA
ncbi:MAG: hypothetical protein HWE27_11475 [Gammaproteobacteria bacterium]|nr:hypothetical protein [Gammaproteobacteria bacterium]